MSVPLLDRYPSSPNPEFLPVEVRIPNGLQHETAVNVYGDVASTSADVNILLTNGLFVTRSVHHYLADRLMRRASQAGVTARVITYDDPNTFNVWEHAQAADDVSRYASRRFGRLVVLGQSKANLTHAAIMGPLLNDEIVSRVHCDVPAGIDNPLERIDESNIPARVVSMVGRSLQSMRNLRNGGDPRSAMVANRVLRSSTRQLIANPRCIISGVTDLVGRDVTSQVTDLARVYGTERVSLSLGEQDEFFSYATCQEKLAQAGYTGQLSTRNTTHMGPLAIAAIAESNFDWAAAA